MIVSREIALYQKKDDSYIESFEIDLSINELVSILNVDVLVDPDVYMIYQINKEQYSKIHKLIPNLKEIDFNKVDLFYECSQID